MGIGIAFTSALSGLSAFSSQMGGIADNLANSNTIGYKRVDASFHSFVTGASESTYSPGGVTATPIYRNNVAGQVATSSIATNFAITGGSGFIPVKSGSDALAAASNLGSSPQAYSQDGSFGVNASGYLTNGSGQYLMGIPESAPFAGVSATASPSLGSLKPVQVSSTYRSMPGTASTLIDYNANFPASLVSDKTTLPASTSQATAQIQFYDSLGTPQTLQITYTKAATGSVKNTDGTTGQASLWRVESASVVSDPTATVFDSAGYPFPDTVVGPQYVMFNQNGALITDPNVGSSFVDASTTFAYVDPNNTGTFAYASSTSVSAGHFGTDFVINGLTDGSSGSSPPSAGPPAAATLPAQTITLDYGSATGGSTQYTGSTLDVRSVSDITGKTNGTYQSASIDSSGDVVFSYSNGATAKPYRVPLVSFPNPNGLTRETGSLFTGNVPAAGSPTARWAGDGDVGTITPSANESSNVDIADELTKMIVAQRSYSANGKVITTTDQMMQETLELKR